VTIIISHLSSTKERALGLYTGKHIKYTLLKRTGDRPSQTSAISTPLKQLSYTQMLTITFVVAIASAVIVAMPRRIRQNDMMDYNHNTNLASSQGTSRRPNLAQLQNKDRSRLCELGEGIFRHLKPCPCRENFLRHIRIEANTKSDLRGIKWGHHQNFRGSLNRFTNPSYV
jgi:hypothetical protein